MSKRIYFDYSATTMADESVIEEFCKVARSNYANPNSVHSLGIEAKEVIDKNLKLICDYFGIEKQELIITSGASESNNMVFKGLKHLNKKHIITTPLEHSSVIGPIGYLQKEGYEVSFVKLNNDGTVDVDDLRCLIKDDTLLISVCAVDSETGVRENIEEIGNLLKDYDVYFHVDMTQAVGKVKIDLENVDLASFSGHKIYAFKGIGGLIKKENVKLYPLIHGGSSTTDYRSGTPQTELISSLGKAFTLFTGSLDEKYDYVKSLNDKIRSHIEKYEDIVINSSDKAIPHILNISFLGKSATDTQDYFDKKGIYMSTKTACASSGDMSKTVYALTGDKERATSSVRISLSYKTTLEEIEELLLVIDKYMGKIK